MVRLGDLIMPANTQRASSKSDLPILSMTMHQGLIDQATKFKKRVASADTSAYKVALAGQLVVGFPIDEGVLSIQTAYPRALVSPAYGIWDIIDPTRVERDYLQKFLKSPPAMSYYAAKLRGSTARRRSLPADVFLSLPVPLPEPNEQRRIAAILDRADVLRTNRHESLDSLAALTIAVFMEMFGDPRASDAEYPRVSIGGLATVMTGNSPPRADPRNYGPGIEWIKSDNLGGYVATRASETLSGLGRERARVAREGSILVTCIAGSPQSIGKASMVDRDVAFNQQINAILPSPLIDATFLLAQLKVAPGLVRSRSSGGMKGLVSKSAFQAIEVLSPPLSLQQEFAARVRAIEQQSADARQSLSEMNVLFASLQSRAFRGEL